MNFMSGRAGFNSQEHGITGSHHFAYSHQQDGGGGGGGDEDSNDQMFGRRSGAEGSSAAAAAASSSQGFIEREHMFDKVVTPSDVGKLNRLVIPKQHAEKYFPLDSSTNEKGLLLNFEDRNGKPWRFRYSYWNSSQSYVMTKGWSRFVKEKKLDAGDIVSFQRGMGELGKDRLFIDWRRRPDATHEFPSHIPMLSLPHQLSFHRSIHPWNPLFLQPPPSREYSHFLQANPHEQHPHHHYPAGYSPYAAAYSSSSVVNGNPCPPGSIFYLRSAPGAAAGGAGGVGVGVFAPQQVNMMQTQRAAAGNAAEQMVFESVPVVQGKAAAKRLRLFGVNMDCPISESDEYDLSSHSTTPLQQLLPTTFDSSTPSPSSSSYHQNIPPLHLRPPPPCENDDKGKGSMSLDLDM